MSGDVGIALVVALIGSGCVRTVEVSSEEVTPGVREQQDVRTATNLPRAFNVIVPAAVTGDCPPRLNDPILRATLYLTRSVVLPVTDSAGTRSEAFGDYRVEPPGHYGLLPGDGLRVDCSNLSAVGAIRFDSNQQTTSAR